MFALAYAVWIAYEAIKAIRNPQKFSGFAALAWLAVMIGWYLTWTPFQINPLTLILWPGSILAYYLIRDLRTK